MHMLLLLLLQLLMLLLLLRSLLLLLRRRPRNRGISRASWAASAFLLGSCECCRCRQRLQQVRVGAGAGADRPCLLLLRRRLLQRRLRGLGLHRALLCGRSLRRGHGWWGGSASRLVGGSRHRRGGEHWLRYSGDHGERSWCRHRLGGGSRRRLL